MTTTDSAAVLVDSPVLTGLQRRQTGLYFAAFVIMGLLVGALGPALPGLAFQTGVHVDAVGVLFTAQFFGLLLGTLASGRLIDRLPVHPLMALCTAVIVITVALIPLQGTLPLLIAVLFMMGFAVGGIGLGGNTALVWVHGHGVGPYMNALHFFFGVGALLSPVMVAQSMDRTGGVSYAYWLMALVMAPLPIFFWRTRSPAVPQSIKEAGSARSQWLPVLLTTILFFLYVGLEIGYSGWLFSYATQLGLASTVTAGYLTSFFWGAFTLARLVSIPLAARVRPRVLLLADLIGIIFFFVLLALWPQTPVVVWVATAGLGVSMASFYPALFTMAGRHIPLTGQVSSIFMAGDNVGAMIIPLLLGMLFAAYGVEKLAMSFLVIAVLAFALFFILLNVFNRERPNVQTLERADV